MCMKDYFEGENAARIRFFHVCTDGKDNGVIYCSEKDYQRAITITAILSHTLRVGIIAFCHMSTHSHFVISCDSPDIAKKFIDSFKRDYSRYLFLDRGLTCAYRRSISEPKEIFDIFYLKNCISYVLLNPVSARISATPETYRWSSFNAYFNEAPSDGTSISSLSARNQRIILKTHKHLAESSIRIDSNGIPVLKSYVDFRFVENLFGSKTSFYKSLALTNSISEEEKYVPRLVRFSDNELYAEALRLSKERYNVSGIHFLTREQKLDIANQLAHKTKVASPRIFRVLKIQ